MELRIKRQQCGRTGTTGRSTGRSEATSTAAEKKNSEKTVKLLRSRYKKITSWGKNILVWWTCKSQVFTLIYIQISQDVFLFFGKATSILLAIPCPDYCQTCWIKTSLEQSLLTKWSSLRGTHYTTIHKQRLGNNSIHGRDPRTKPLLVSYLPNSILFIP